MTMRVGILSYPMLFQRDGGLQIQVRETIAALNRLPQLPARHLEVQLVDANHQRLADFDVLHVFSASNGTYRIMEMASEQGVPVVLSPLLSPGWGRASAWRARLADRLAGRLTQWMVQTSYAQTRRALQLADVVIALGEAERDAIVQGFGMQADAIRVLPNGINPYFFTANGDLFLRETGIAGPFVLMTGSISPYKNQLGLALALAGAGLPLVLIGAAPREQQAYLQQLLDLPHVSWIGALDHADPLLASAYHAAAVAALPSQGEVFPLSVLEALAAGTPVVMTAQSALDLPDSAFALRKVAWDDGPAQRQAILDLLALPPERARVQALVERFTWERVAAQIADCYYQLQSLPARRQHAV
ncbi:glycosyltransferase [Janthinobacterium svalbardensis]|uniref:Glycosyltransferase n=2 Tax=Janthinobacterium svalbardensis TaxID=368607 RepID=A0A290WXK3_9BURK|nr:glycosyltransferase [Janthinobacterium svalbardensis]